MMERRHMAGGSETEFDLVVVGAGPAGLMAAITAAERGTRVAVLEYLPDPGRKLLASGAGKCNLTNALDPAGMAARFAVDPRFVRRALSAFSPDALRAWLLPRGVRSCAADGFHYFPVSGRAADVLKALLVEAERFRVRLCCGVDVEQLLTDAGHVAGVAGGGRVFSAPHVVIATGGMGYPALGGRGSGYRLAEQAGHTIVPPVPALVGLRTAAAWPGELAGLVLERSLVRFGRRVGEGELLFTRTGISGPAVLDLSGEVNRALLSVPEVQLEINLCAGMGGKEWRDELESWRRDAGKRQLRTLLGMKFSARFAERLLGVAGGGGELRAAELPGTLRDRLIGLLTALPLAVTGSDGWNKAMATAGGVATAEVNPATLASRLLPGLYFAGEVLDVGAPCGGFNIQWAFSSGRVAGLLR